MRAQSITLSFFCLISEILNVKHDTIWENRLPHRSLPNFPSSNSDYVNEWFEDSLTFFSIRNAKVTCCYVPEGSSYKSCLLQFRRLSEQSREKETFDSLCSRLAFWWGNGGEMKLISLSCGQFKSEPRFIRGQRLKCLLCIRINSGILLLRHI